MKKPYVPKRILTVQLPLDLFDKLEGFAEKMQTTKTGALIKILEEVKA